MRKGVAIFFFVAVLLPSVQAQFSTIVTPSKPFYNVSLWSIEYPLPVNGTATNLGNPFTIGGINISINRSIAGGATEYWSGSAWVSTQKFVSAIIDPPGGGDSVSFFYAFTPPADAARNYTFKSIAIDSAGAPVETPSTKEGITTTFDPFKPFPFLSPFLPLWTNIPSIGLSIDGYDLESGILDLRLFYKISDPNGVVQDWKLDKTFSSGGDYTFLAEPDKLNNYTYRLIVQGNDKAGNNNVSVTLLTTFDTLKPICTMVPLPPYVPQTFFVNWSILENISGLLDIDVEYSFNQGPWQDLNGTCGTLFASNISAYCSSLGAGPYSFRCRGRDAAQNQGDYSAPATTALDPNSPTANINPLPPYSNTYSFILGWNGSDLPFPSSGIKCFNVQWIRPPTATWTYLLNSTGGYCMNGSTIIFGDGVGEGDPLTSDGQLYQFRVNASDNVGNEGPLSATQTLIIDTLSPSINLSASDQDGNPFSEGSKISSIHINTSADDNISGINYHFIFIMVTKEGVNQYSNDCTGLPTCELTQSVEGADSVEFYAHVIDYAGNINETQHFIFSPHPLANFVTHDVVFPTGSTFSLDVQVRNMNSTPINLTLEISDYLLAGFTVGSGNFQSYTLSSDARMVNITELQPGGSGLFKVELLATGPQDYIDVLTLIANSTSGISDSDSMHIMITFPASFSAWSDWAVLLLLLLCLPLYYRLKN